MSPDDEHRHGDLSEQFPPPAARARAHGRARSGRAPRSPRVRQAWAWVLLGGALTGLTLGIALGQGLVIAAGLVLAGIGVRLFEPAAGTASDDGRGQEPDGHGHPARPW